MIKMVAAFLTAATLVTVVMAADNNSTSSEVYIPSENVIEISTELENNFLEYIETNNVEELEYLIKVCQERMKYAEDMTTAAYGCGYSSDHPIFDLAEKEYKCAEKCYLKYTEKYDKLTLKEKADEYPVATEIWLYLKDKGYNDYVCAGILGNLMTEVGGQTLDIQYWLGNNSYYGMCQWSLKYFNPPKDLVGQCDYLIETIEEAFDVFGYNYRRNFDYEAFLKLKDERKAALAFAACYERCCSDYYEIRMDNAEIAYKYFTN